MTFNLIWHKKFKSFWDTCTSKHHDTGRERK